MRVITAEFNFSQVKMETGRFVPNSRLATIVKYKLEFTLTGINGALPFFLCWFTIIC